MTRSLAVIIRCDGCYEHIDGGEDHEGSLLLTVGSSGVRQIDLCDECLTSGTSVRGLLTIYADAEVIPPAKSKGTNNKGSFPCPICEHVSLTAQARGRHVKSEHGTTMADLTA